MYGKDFTDELERYEARYPPERKRAALIEALHAVQDRAGHVTGEAMDWLGARYGISAAEVRGVVTFYTMFFTQPRGKHVIWLCRTFPCELMGSKRVMAALEEALGCKAGETDPSGTFTLRWMECLAACDKAPCALVDDDMVDYLTPEAVRLVLDHVKAGGCGGAIVVKADGQYGLAPAPLTCKQVEAR